ncbi:hypothetical protein ACA910_007876 [Epithemia clementina (nom. ined.)]
MAPRRSARRAAAAAQSDAAKASAAPVVAASQNKRGPSADAQSKATRTKRAKPSKKIKHSGLLSKLVDTEAPLGVVDPEAGIDGTILSLDDHPCDVMLVLVDPAKNMDMFLILQLIETTKRNVYCVYTRWGRTGTTGQALNEEFPDYNAAEDTFRKNFQEKTGLNWENRGEPTNDGKHRYIEQDYLSKQEGFTSALWQYWVDDGVDGKDEGWHDYDQEGSIQAERLFSEHAKNIDLANRWVVSGACTYELDLVNMTQTNVFHPTHTVRRIRRCPSDAQPEDGKTRTDKTKTNATKVGKEMCSASTTKMVPATPVRSSTQPSTPSASPITSSNARVSRPPVDPEVSLFGRNAADFEVVPFHNNPNRYYDVVLNQCNITGGNNNNKYYRIQMIRDLGSGQFFVWQKWGRVGEPGRKSSSALKGPFASEDGALREYSSKFKAKTGNNYDTDNFVTASGKYTLIEMDNDVKVEGNADTAAPSTPIRYEQSNLDNKTKELIEVLFSKDMRNEALTDLKLDLKRLPLGVPSQQQIQQGISILQKIENKLGGSSVAGSYEELSSQFYTAIPHSFGHTRPPTINTSEYLQTRYDMCNILLDMYSTNETVRQLEEADSKKTEAVVPNPVDRHYETLHTDLKLLDAKSSDFIRVMDYFQNTRGRHSSARLLDVWEVNRHSEGQRFKKFDMLDNRRLLWHGTNIAVVAPILTNGLRIMPHSGGRVGSGIYLAALQEKSAQYTSGYQAKYACMFLCEAAMGKMHAIHSDGHHASSLKKAPSGFDSVHAVGKLTPKVWGDMEIDNKKVYVPVDKAEERDIETSFYHDEFLCYDEAQVRIRYILTVRL